MFDIELIEEIIRIKSLKTYNEEKDKDRLVFELYYDGIYPEVNNCFPVVFYKYCFRHPDGDFLVVRNYINKGAEVVDNFIKEEEEIDNSRSIYRVVYRSIRK